jgi:putative protease
MPGGNLSFDLPGIIGRDGKPSDSAPGSGHVVKIRLPDGAEPSSIDEFALLVRYLPSKPGLASTSPVGGRHAADKKDKI